MMPTPAPRAPRRVNAALTAAVALTALLLGALAPAARAQAPAVSDWGYYGGDAFGRRFSSLDQINRGNVGKLTLAWSYRTGELGAGFARASRGTSLPRRSRPCLRNSPKIWRCASLRFRKESLRSWRRLGR